MYRNSQGANLGQDTRDLFVCVKSVQSLEAIEHVDTDSSIPSPQRSEAPHVDITKPSQPLHHTETSHSQTVKTSEKESKMEGTKIALGNRKSPRQQRTSTRDTSHTLIEQPCSLLPQSFILTGGTSEGLSCFRTACGLHNGTICKTVQMCSTIHHSYRNSQSKHIFPSHDATTLHPLQATP